MIETSMQKTWIVYPQAMVRERDAWRRADVWMGGCSGERERCMAEGGCVDGWMQCVTIEA